MKYNYKVNEGIIKNNKHIIVAICATLALTLTLIAGRQAGAAKNPIGEGFSNAAPGTVGPSISGEIYGNTSNPSGNGNGVLPSYSPGPWVCTDPNDCAGPTTAGGSMGDFIAPIASDGQASPDFANGTTDPGPDFSAH